MKQVSHTKNVDISLKFSFYLLRLSSSSVDWCGGTLDTEQYHGEHLSIKTQYLQTNDSETVQKQSDLIVDC